MRVAEGGDGMVVTVVVMAVAMAAYLNPYIQLKGGRAR